MPLQTPGAAQLLVSGPAEIWLGVGNVVSSPAVTAQIGSVFGTTLGNTLQGAAAAVGLISGSQYAPTDPGQITAPTGLAFLGYSTPGGVWAEFVTRTQPVRSDIKCFSPHDAQYGGQEAFVGCDLVEIATDVLYAAMQKCRPSLSSPVPRGVDLPGWRGGLMLAEGAAVRLLLFPPYSATKNQMNTYRPHNFPAAVMVGPERFSPIGSPVTRVRCLWHCLSVAAGTGADLGTELLYNFDAAGKGTPPLAFMG